MRRQVGTHVVHSLELLITSWTNVDLVTLVCTLMHLAVAALSETLRAEGTNKGTFTRVSTAMVLQNIERRKAHRTQIASIGSFASVLSLVFGQ